MCPHTLYAPAIFDTLATPMRKLASIIIILFCFSIPAQALFIIETNDIPRPGRSGVAMAQVAAGTAINISWGIWERSNMYFVVGSGAGLGWKQRLLQEGPEMPLSLDLTAETVSWRDWHTTMYGVDLRKQLLDDLNGFIRLEAGDNNADWPSLKDLTTQSIFTYGLNWKVWQDINLLLSASNGPEMFGTFGLNILL